MISNSYFTQTNEKLRKKHIFKKKHVGLLDR